MESAFFEADLGRGRLLRLFEDRFEWRAGGKGKPLSLDLSRIAQVRLLKRAAWESWIFVAAFACGAWLAPALRWPFALLAAWAVAAGLQTKCSLEFGLKDGGQLVLLLGIGGRRSKTLARIEGIWSSFSAELQRLGIPTA